MVHLSRDRLIELGIDALEESARSEPREIGIHGVSGDAHFACALQREEPGFDARRWIDRAVDACFEEGGICSLHRGVGGLAMVLATYFKDVEEYLREFDAVFLEQLPSLPPASIQSGVAGLGLYASLRAHADSGELQRAIVESLKASAFPRAGGVVWHTPLDYVNRGRDEPPTVPGEPILELGMVHGVAGTLVALAALSKQGWQDAADLARAGMRAVWALERPSGQSRFAWEEQGAHLQDRAIGPDCVWCLGDFGVLYGLWFAARSLDDAGHQERAVEALRAHARKTCTEPLGACLDLCCGASITAQAYLRLFEATGEESFRAARARLLDHCARGVQAMNLPNFRFGKQGVLLTLLSAESEKDLGWDAMVAVSLPRNMATGA